MKNILLSAIALYIVSVGFSTKKIEGTFAKTSKKKIYLFELKVNGIEKIDSADIKNNKFALKLNQELDGVYYIGFQKDTLLSFVAEGQTLSIAFSDENDLSESVVAPVEPFKEYSSYQDHIDSYDKHLSEINKKALNASKTIPQSTPAFNEAMQKLKASWDSLHGEDQQFFSDLKKNQSSHFAKKIGAFFDRSGKTKETYLTENDFKDPYYIRGNFLSRKINMYLMVFVPLNRSNANEELKTLLAKAPNESVGRELLYRMVIQTAFNIDQSLAKKYVQMYKLEYPNSVEASRLAAFFAPEIGDQAPEISAQDPNGKTYTLSELKGKVVLLDFWASWCRPCLYEMPNVVAAYEKYKEKGFEVYSVSLDSNKDRWVAAIEKFNMAWPYHVSDLRKWSSVPAKKYRVSGIPATFLIDEDGVIIGKNLRGEALENRLAELFEK